MAEQSPQTARFNLTMLSRRARDGEEEFKFDRGIYSETRVTVSRNHGSQVDATQRSGDPAKNQQGTPTLVSL
jgi:hypothetical protein